MAEAVVPIKHLDDVIECPICSKQYTDPRTLPCTHTFCFKCIAETSKDKHPKKAVSCPVCHKDFTVPADGIQELPKNSFVVKLLTLRQLFENPTDIKLCGVYSEDDESWGRDRTVKMFCVDCQQHMCNLCSQSHSKMRASSHHHLVNRGEPLNDVCNQYPPASCDKHRDKYLEIYCFDCKSVVCITCYVTEHAGHTCSDVGKVADSFRKEMVKDAETINDAIKSLDDKLKSLENTKNDFVENIQTVETEICKKADEQKSLIDLHKKQLLDEVADIKSIRMKEIDNVSNDIAKDKSLLDSFRGYCEELVKKGSPSDIAGEANRLRCKAAEIVKLDSVGQSLSTSVKVKFVTSVLLKHMTKNVLGKVVPENAPA